MTTTVQAAPTSQDHYPSRIVTGTPQLLDRREPTVAPGAREAAGPLTPEQVDEWISVVREAAQASIGPMFTATPNSGCAHCGLVQACPAQLRGKAVIDD